MSRYTSQDFCQTIVCFIRSFNYGYMACYIVALEMAIIGYSGLFGVRNDISFEHNANIKYLRAILLRTTSKISQEYYFHLAYIETKHCDFILDLRKSLLTRCTGQFFSCKTFRLCPNLIRYQILSTPSFAICIPQTFSSMKPVFKTNTRQNHPPY